MSVCVRACACAVTGDLEKMSELISGMAPRPEEESPYEALFEATSCHSLDSLASGKSSDRDSGRPDSDAGKVSATPADTLFGQQLFSGCVVSDVPTRGR